MIRKKFFIKFSSLFLSLFLASILLAGSVEIVGRTELNFALTSDLKTSLSSKFPGDNALYLVLKSGGAVMVLDMKFGEGAGTGPVYTGMYVNELFVPWKVHNNLTVFFGYRNVSDYDSFLEADGQYKWAYNETGIFWYKSTFSFVYSTPWFVVDGGVNPKTTNDPLNFGLLFRTKLGNVSLAANLTGDINFSIGIVGARVGFNFNPIKFYLAAGYDYKNATIKGILVGGSYELKPIKLLIEGDFTALDPNRLKLYGYLDYKIGNFNNDSIGVFGFANLEEQKFSVEPYYFTKLGQAEIRPSLVFDRYGFKQFNVKVSFGF